MNTLRRLGLTFTLVFILELCQMNPPEASADIYRYDYAGPNYNWLWGPSHGPDDSLYSENMRTTGYFYIELDTNANLNMLAYYERNVLEFYFDDGIRVLSTDDLVSEDDVTGFAFNLKSDGDGNFVWWHIKVEIGSRDDGDGFEIFGATPAHDRAFCSDATQFIGPGWEKDFGGQTVEGPNGARAWYPDEGVNGVWMLTEQYSVPVPGTLWLLFSGLAGLCGAARKPENC